MADHFYGILPAKCADAAINPDADIVVGTSTAGSTYIELRVPDAIATLTGAKRALYREFVRNALEALEEYWAMHPLPLGE